MSISHPGSSLPALVRDGRRFWATPQGQALHHAERACLGPVCEGVFGVHSLELGMGDPLADMCPVRHPMRWSPTRELAQGPSTLVCTPDALPLPDGCLSLVIVHHLLEVVPDPHHLLQEAARVTRDDGRLILFGWMPLSAGALPRVDYCGFHLPGGMPRNAALETLGRRYNLPLGDSYMIQASRRSQLAQTQGGRLQFGRPFGGSALGATRVGQPRLSPPQERMTEVD